MSLAGLGPKSESKYICLIIAYTGRQDAVLYRGGDKGDNDADCPPEGGPLETEGLSASSLPLNIDRPAWMPGSPLKSLRSEAVADRASSLGGIFVSASHLTGVDTRSKTRRSIIVGIRGEEGRGRAEARALLDFAGHRAT